MRPPKPNGFILLEVLIAMSLILGAWTVSVGVFQALALRLTQEEAKRTELRLAFDAYEISGGHSHVGNLIHKGAKNESSGMPSWHRVMHHSAQSITKNGR
jgi:hypothetical protein